MNFRIRNIILVTILGVILVACATSDATSQNISVDQKPTGVPSGQKSIATAELATKMPTSAPLVPTEVMISAVEVTKDTQKEEYEVNPSATNTQEEALPTVTEPTATAESKEVSFASPADYDRFSSEEEQAFRQVVEDEFGAATEKAGISVAVYDGDRLWTYAMGEADTGRNIDIDTPILVGSTSKTFVSALVLNQIEKGYYGLADTVGVILADHPDYASFDQTKVNSEVTISEMLSMTSGLADYNENFKGKAGLFSAPDWKPADNINLLQSEYSMPGKFEYVDTNLVLLGLIAEKYGENDLYSLYREEFLEPLGISALFLSAEAVPGNTARPYDDISNYGGTFGNLIDAAPYSFEHYSKGQGRVRWACCGLISTPENMARWGYELYSRKGKAVSEESRKVLYRSTEGDLVNFQGSKQNYGYYLAKRMFTLSDSSEISAYGHPGGGGGYSSLLRYSPELDLSISILANSTLSFQGECVDYAPRSCIASGIFDAYSQ